MKTLIWISIGLTLGVIIGTSGSNFFDMKSKARIFSKVNRIIQTAKPVLPLKVVGWIPYWDAPAAFESFVTYSKNIDAVGLFWYHLTPTGTIASYKSATVDPKIIVAARAANVQVMAVLANMPDYTEDITNWDWQRVDLVISTAEARQNHITEIVNLVIDNKFDGLDLDYEALRSGQRDDFSLFVSELAAALHEKGKLLGVAVHPKTSETDPNEDNGSHGQDWQSIIKVVDKMYLMTYTEHYKGSQPGPPGSLPWIERVVEYANTLGLPPEKIYLGIGLNGMEWRESAKGRFVGVNDDVTYSQVDAIMKSESSSPYWDETLQSYKLEFDKSGKKHVIWFDETRSVAARVKLAQKYSLGGVALWRLGGEDSRIWDHLPVRSQASPDTP